jgi:hypothetical protein
MTSRSTDYRARRAQRCDYAVQLDEQRPCGPVNLCLPMKSNEIAAIFFHDDNSGSFWEIWFMDSPVQNK